MNLKYLIIYFTFTLILYLVVSINYLQELNNLDIYITNLTFVFIYYISLLSITYSSRIQNYKVISLVVLAFGLIYISIYNYLYFNYTGTFFEFTGSDSTFYHFHSQISKQYSYFQGIENYVERTRFGYDDSGMIAYLSLLYRIIDHPLFPRFVNVFIHLLTVFFTYKISKNFISKENSIIVSLIYGLASYSLFYVSSGLKEPIFNLFVVISFYSYLQFYKTRKIYHVLFLTLFSSIIVLFRLPVAIFVLSSIFLTEFLFRKFSIKKLLIVFMLIALSIYLYITYIDLITMYVGLRNPNLNDTEYLPGLFENMLIIFSGFFGPLPTILPISGHENDSLWAPSLILKMYLSIYFVYGIFIILKNKNPFLFSIVLMCLLNIISLIIVKNTFKVRYIMPYLPLFFIIVGYSFEKIKNERAFNMLRLSVLPVNIALTVIILGWNLMRL
ncbi:MAG: hypothetical protein ACOCP8_10120 [archaeon]